MSNVNLLNAALNYQAKGFSVIPFSEKKPLIPWKQYQTEIPTVEALTEMFSNPECTQIAVVLGSVSGDLECIQIDDPFDTAISEFLRQMRDILLDGGYAEDELCIVKKITRGRNSYHVYYRCQDHLTGSMKLAEHIFPEFGRAYVEVSSNAKCMIVPPSPGYEVIFGNMFEIPVLANETIRRMHKAAAIVYDHHKVGV